MIEQQQEKFETWGLLELFGHTRIAGRISSVQIAGTGFIQIDIPAISENLEQSRIYGTSAVYGITPMTEEMTRKYAESLQVRPLIPYEGERQRALGFDNYKDEE